MAAIASFAALLLRLVFLVAGLSPLPRLLRRRASSDRTVGTTLAALAALFLSSLLGSGDASRLPWLVVLLAASAAFLVVVRKSMGASPVFAIYAASTLLVGIGTCIVFDVLAREYERLSYASPTTGYARHATFALAALAFAAAFVLLCTRWPRLRDRLTNLLKGHQLLVLVLTLGLLAATVVNYLRNPINPGSGPSELAKIATVAWLASYLAANSARLATFSLRGILPVAVVSTLSLGMLVLSHDLGCALIFFALLAFMLTSSTKRGTGYLVLLVLVFLAFVLVAYYVLPLVHVPTAKERVDWWLGIESNLQLDNARDTIANGGLIGCGLGHGKAFFSIDSITTSMTVAFSDDIFATTVEELGLLGGFVVMLCYVSIAVATARSASAWAHGTFERNLVFGLGALVGVEAFINIGGVVGAIPFTGITLPLVSWGVWSLMSTMVAVALACAYDGTRPADVVAQQQDDAWHASTITAPEQKTSAKLGRPNAPTAFAAISSIALVGCLVLAAGIQLPYGIRPCGDTAHRVFRGSIYSSDGVTLAYDEAREGSATEVDRVYPEGTLAAHVLGEDSGGLDARPLSDSSWLANLLALAEHGQDTTLTIDSRVQAEAERQLSGYAGAIVCLDPTTGAVLAMASSPTYDPNSPGLGGDYFNRAAQGAYEPGSTFKLVTLSAALEAGIATPDTVFEGPATMDFGGADVRNFQDIDWGTLSLTDALNHSVNTVFAQLGVELGSSGLDSQAKAYLFGQQVPFDIETASTAFVDPTTENELAWTAVGSPYGSAEISTHPLHMALVMASIANGGTMVRPYLVEGTSTTTLGQPIDEETAQTICDMLSQSTTGDDASAYHLIGKTGTDEVDGQESNAWYVGLGTNEDRQVVVAAVVENVGTGFEQALPKAAAVADAALAL